jgi:type I restriction enzyme R subunit
MVESEVEEAALEWLDSLGWAYRGGPEIAPGELFAGRGSCGQIVLAGRRPAAFSRYGFLCGI